jgi:hypothetical protein
LTNAKRSNVSRDAKVRVTLVHWPPTRVAEAQSWSIGQDFAAQSDPGGEASPMGRAGGAVRIAALCRVDSKRRRRSGAAANFYAVGRRH